MRQLQLNYEMINHNLWQDFSWLDINISFMAGYKCNKLSEVKNVLFFLAKQLYTYIC